MKTAELIKVLKKKVLVFIKLHPVSGVTKQKAKKRWGSTVDNFYFHHWFRTYNLCSNRCVSKSSCVLLLRSRLDEEVRDAVGEAGRGGLRVECGWGQVPPSPLSASLRRVTHTFESILEVHFCYSVSMWKNISLFLL